ncbi:MAG TPA: DUF4097 family beta strand repeat-containing protein [Candidatus Polarisedimenticolia bacterium]|nr:DUF4097 family beta strand repeat-containing protein [Candidatus Polarisedimenticolia bacterium]
MRRRSILLSVLILGLAAAAPTLAADNTRTLRVELTDPSRPFAVENLAGRMTVVAGSGRSVVAVATVHAESADLAGAISFEEVEGTDGRPTLRVRYPLADYGSIKYSEAGQDSGLLSLFDGNSNTSTRYDGYKVKVSSGSGVAMWADVEVQVPSSGIDATFKNVVGRVAAADVAGTLSFDTGSGDIDLQRMSGSVEADTGSGDVNATQCRGSIDCDTGSGDCRITDFDGDRIAGDVGSGEIIVRSGTAREIDLDTGSGDIIVEGAEVEKFAADTGSGDILLETDSPRLASIDADTGSGDVTLRLGAGASFVAYADQGSGDIVCRFTDAEAIVQRREVVGYRRGGEQIRIDVDTGSGDLVIEQ